jgi:GAF domain-containing protein
MTEKNREPVNEIDFLDQRAQDFIATADDHLSHPKNVDAVLARVIAEMTEFIGAEAASLFLVDESTGDIVLKYAIGDVGEKIVGLRLGHDEGVVGWVVRFNEDLIVPYPGMDTRFFEGVDKETGFHTRSILCGPIRTNGTAIGAIEVLNKKDGTFNDDDLVLLRAIARSVAKVIPQIGP